MELLKSHILVENNLHEIQDHNSEVNNLKNQLFDN